VSTAAELGARLSRDEAGWIAAELRASGLTHRAARRAFPTNQLAVKPLLSALLAEQGDQHRAAAVLDGIAAVPRLTRPDIVWSCPSVPGIDGRTTLAVAEIINEAKRSVYAATFSVNSWSPYVKTLKLALDRGVAVTLVLDSKLQAEATDHLAPHVPGARLWTYAKTDASQWPPRQHAKFVVIDDDAALVTSANFSDAAARKNLECGLLTRDPEVARGLRQQIDRLREHGVLMDL